MLSLYVLTATLSVGLLWTTAGGCPSICRCDRRKAVNCIGKNLTGIPYRIPLDTKILFLYSNNIVNGRATDRLLSNLQDLRKLEMQENNLNAIPKDLPASLEIVNFKYNNIRYVGKQSFQGLTLLEELFLDGNNITNQGLSSQAFEGLQSLQLLDLSNNRLTQFYENLPPSLKVLRLANNLIQGITRKATERLNALQNLLVSQNAIVQTLIQPGSLEALISLKTLDMSRNQLTQIPRNLPKNLQNLLLSGNKIQYLFNNENNVHGTIAMLKQLRSVDLSSNNIKSVQPGSFASVIFHSFELRDNPWQCDCHLYYLKSWLSGRSTLSREGDIQCRSPSAFSGVTLDALDQESLTCDARNNGRNHVTVVQTTSTSLQLLWREPKDTPDPPFIRRWLLYGPLECANCSVEHGLLSDKRNVVSSLMKTYVLRDITDNARLNSTDIFVTVSNLDPETHYLACTYDSAQKITNITVSQCKDFWTLLEVVTTVPTPIQNDTIVYLLSVIIASAVGVVIAIIAVVVWRKKRRLKSKIPPVYYSDQDEYAYGDAQSPEYLQPHGFRPILAAEHRTYMPSRIYEECGPPSTASKTLTDAAIDARMEFDVLIKAQDNMSTKHTCSPVSFKDR